MRHLRDQIQQPVSLDYFQQRIAAGWKLKAIEWEQEDGEEAAGVLTLDEAASPFGLELVPETSHLRQKPEEVDILMTILELIVVEKGVSHIAAELNARGFTTRRGAPWTSSAVFNLLPRLIEAAPDLLKSKDWQTRRANFKSGGSQARTH